MKVVDRQALQSWELYHTTLASATTVNELESVGEQKARIAKLKVNPEAWFRYYFPKYCSSPAAAFHIKASRRILQHKRWYEVRAWSRELAKSTRTMMETLYLVLNEEVSNILLISNSEDNAIRLLKPYKINLEKNPRIIQDYGKQMNYGHWEDGEFITKAGVSFRGIGAQQSPRGSKNENIRPDMILIDDIDTDEECRNPTRIADKWKWIEQALIPTLSVSGNYRILFCGNIIAKDCTIVRAIEKANHTDVINIRDNNGKSSWAAKNSEADIDAFLNMISYASAQKEFFNNPIEEGSVFKEITWDKVPPLNRFRYVVAYGDPAPSNKENKSNCTKALPVVGESGGKFYVFTCFLNHVTNAAFVRWYYDVEQFIQGKTQIYNYIENNSLQDPFYEQVFIPLFLEEGSRQNHYIHVIPDDRKKPDKFARIEGNLEPINRQGRLIFNIDEKANPNMQRLVDQFKAVDHKLSSDVDGPDAVEGAVWIINTKLSCPTQFKIGTKKENPKRY